jgi:leucyl-tRNA synthetase
VDGVHRFLNRVWRLFARHSCSGEAGGGEHNGRPARSTDENARRSTDRNAPLRPLRTGPGCGGGGSPAGGERPTAADQRLARERTLHAAIDKVTRELEALRFNNCEWWWWWWCTGWCTGCTPPPRPALPPPEMTATTDPRHTARPQRLARPRPTCHVGCARSALDRPAARPAGISALMTFVNEANKWPVAEGRGAPAAFTLEMRKSFVLLLAPFAPHLAEELWQHQVPPKPGPPPHPPQICA